MDKNSENRCKNKEIKVIRPVKIKDGLLIDPVTPQDHGGKRFDDFLGDEIGTEKIVFTDTLKDFRNKYFDGESIALSPFTEFSFQPKDFRDEECYKNYLISVIQKVIIKYPY